MQSLHPKIEPNMLEFGLQAPNMHFLKLGKAHLELFQFAGVPGPAPDALSEVFQRLLNAFGFRFSKSGAQCRP